MGILIALFCLLFILIIFDIRQRFVFYFDPRHSFRNLSRLQFLGLKSLLAIVKTFMGFKIILDSRVQEELPETFLIISNHQSLADIPVLAYAFPNNNVRFVAKKELKYGIPSISFALRKGRHALISRRGSFKEAHRELIKLARLSREGVCPAVFPEGTRARSGRVKLFHSAAVRTIMKHAYLPAISVAISGGYRISKLRDLTRNLRNCVYRVRLLSLYPATRERGRIQAILRQAHDEIERQVDQWRKKGK